MRDVGGGPHQGSRPDFALVISDDDPRLSRQDQIKFVRAGVQVNRLRLSGFEAIQSYEEPGAQRDVDFGCLLTAEDGRRLE